MPPNRKFKPVMDDNGHLVRGMHDCDICRIEKKYGGWRALAPLCTVGRSQIGEFCPIEQGGEWADIGHYRVKAEAMDAAIRLESGLYVYQHAGDGIPGMLIEYRLAAERIKGCESQNGE